MVDVAKLFVVFALMMILLNRKVNLGLVMVIAAVVLGVFFRMDATTIAQTALAAIIKLDTLTLILVLLSVMVLENILRKTFILQRLVDALKELIPDHRLVMAIMPAFIGLLPSPGGAMFSAPMVEEASRDFELSPERMSFINFWYRHIWEYIIPLYPGFFLATQILAVPIRDLVVLQLPIAIMVVLAGIPVAFWGLNNRSSTGKGKRSRRAFLDLAIGMGPITAIIVLVLLFNLNLVIALALAVLVLIVANRYDWKQILALREALSLDIVLLVIGVVIFQDMLERSGAIDTLPAFASSEGIPLAVVVFALPFAVGLLTGWANAFVGISFPILHGLLASGAIDMSMAAFGFASGYAGVMLSPAHLCLVLTIRHFKADFGRVQLMLLLPQAAVVIGAALFYLRH